MTQDHGIDNKRTPPQDIKSAAFAFLPRFIQNKFYISVVLSKNLSENFYFFHKMFVLTSNEATLCVLFLDGDGHTSQHPEYSYPNRRLL